MGEKTEIKNAKIIKLSICFERMPTFFVHLDYGGLEQAAGCIMYGSNDGNFVRHLRLLCKTLESETWEELKGKSCRVETTWTKVLRIGHFLKDQWFEFDYIKELQNFGYKENGNEKN